MNYEESCDKFNELLDKVSDEARAQFLIWIERRFFVSECRGSQAAEARMTLRNIAEDIKQLVPPYGGVLSSENLVPPTGENADCDPKHTIHVDSFLYEDMDLNDLESEGKFQRYYCQDCDSRNIAQLDLLSHSCSIERIDYIFSSFLPYLKDKVVLDVGSRLGALLYGAYVYTPAPEIIGVELNKEWADISVKMVEKNNMADRIKVVCDDICNQPELVRKADVVILNNVFEFFLPPEQQVKAWKFLREHVKSGALLVTVPKLEKSLEGLEVGFKVSDWVKFKPVTDPLLVMSMESQPELAPICVYEVL